MLNGRQLARSRLRSRVHRLDAAVYGGTRVRHASRAATAAYGGSAARARSGSARSGRSAVSRTGDCSAVSERSANAGVWHGRRGSSYGYSAFGVVPARRAVSDDASGHRTGFQSGLRQASLDEQLPAAAGAPDHGEPNVYVRRSGWHHLGA